MSGTEPREAAEQVVRDPVLPTGPGEHFAGYGVMGCGFDSGHYLAFRHFPASSVGPGYRAVWHRAPDGRWQVHADAPPEVSCARYLGSALSAAHTAPVGVAWTGERSFVVTVDGLLSWTIRLEPSPATRLMTAMSVRVPEWGWRSGTMLRGMGVVAGPLLSSGRIRLTGRMPNGQTFRGSPKRVWRIVDAEAELAGWGLGRPAPLPAQVRLGDFWLPQRPLFFADATSTFQPAAA